VHAKSGSKRGRFFMFWSKSSDFHQVHDFSIHHLLIFIKFTSSRFRCNFLEFLIQTGFFFFMSACVCEIDIEWWSWVL
jgi:hypothetical protein